MTIDEAIKHAEEVADLCEDSASRYDMTDSLESHMACKDGKCAEEHRQIAEWLKELKLYREIFGSMEFEHIDINFEPIDVEERIKDYENLLDTFKNIDLGDFKYERKAKG